MNTLAAQFHEGGPRTGLEYLQYVVAQSHRHQLAEGAGNYARSGGGGSGGGGGGGGGGGYGYSSGYGATSAAAAGGGGGMMNGHHGGTGTGKGTGVGLGVGAGNVNVIDRVNAMNGDSNLNTAAATAAIPTPLASARAWLVSS